MQTLKDKIINILLESKLLNKEQIEQALAAHKTKGVSLRKALLEEGAISEEILLSVISRELYIPTIHLSKYKFDRALVELVPERMARLYKLIPLSRIGETLTVAMADPLNVFALDDLRALTGCRVDIVLSPDDEIARSIEAQYRQEAQDMQDLLEESLASPGVIKESPEQPQRQGEIELGLALKESEKVPIVKIVNLMLAQALEKRASDIHIEPEETSLRIRYRIDGALYDMFKLPKINQPAVIARIKIISNLDITENRLPQDGRFKVRFESKEVDFRVSALPTTFGQKFVLRLLDKSNLSIGLDKLGFNEKPLEVFKQAVKKPFGMILVTGPTGSGKSTTLYSVLNQLNSPDKNIVTIEDPVEYQVDGITQVQVKSEVGLSFASGLRSILRQNPDVVMVGEIRDPETADIAIKAALTGHLVLSTLHTNDAISSITRLIDMGVEPFLVASSLVMLCAQRLCRRICPKCKKETEVKEEYLKEIGFKQKVKFYNSAGCKYCNNTGFHGRVAILEAIMLDDPMREMIIKKEAIDKMKQYAVEKRGMLDLRSDAFLKVQQEVTSLEEALSVTTQE